MRLTDILFRAARASATARAIRRGRAPQRAANLTIGRLAGRLLDRVWR